MITDSFPPTNEGVSAARRFVTGYLETDDPQVGQDIALVVSELATNATLHAATAFTVAVERHHALLRIEVADGDSTLPQIKHHELTAPSGRGLEIIEKLAAGWGVFPSATGKVVWVEMMVPAP